MRESPEKRTDSPAEQERKPERIRAIGLALKNLPREYADAGRESRLTHEIEHIERRVDDGERDWLNIRAKFERHKLGTMLRRLEELSADEEQLIATHASNEAEELKKEFGEARETEQKLEKEAGRQENVIIISKWLGRGITDKNYGDARAAHTAFGNLLNAKDAVRSLSEEAAFAEQRAAETRVAAQPGIEERAAMRARLSNKGVDPLRDARKIITRQRKRYEKADERKVERAILQRNREERKIQLRETWEGVSSGQSEEALEKKLAGVQELRSALEAALPYATRKEGYESLTRYNARRNGVAQELYTPFYYADLVLLGGRLHLPPNVRQALQEIVEPREGEGRRPPRYARVLKPRLERILANINAAEPLLVRQLNAVRGADDTEQEQEHLDKAA